jgi:hypothetical protein
VGGYRGCDVYWDRGDCHDPRFGPQHPNRYHGYYDTDYGYGGYGYGGYGGGYAPGYGYAPAW